MKLTVLKNNIPVMEYLLDTNDAQEHHEIFIGRSEDCHVKIDDPLVSRHHILISSEKNQWYCQKLSQLGVVSINGNEVSRHEVKNGDEVKFGVYSLILSELVQGVPEVQSTISETLEVVAPKVEEKVIQESFEQENNESQEMASIEDNENTYVESDEVGQDSDESEDIIEIAQEGDEEGFGSEADQEESIFASEANDNLPIESDQESSEEFAGFEMTPADESYSDSDEGTRFFKAFVNYQLILFGEYAPYDRYLVEEDEIFIGRDEKKCQIILNDPEVSSLHAVIKKINSVITLEDLNSSNGTILNGERINKHEIVAGDEFVIGSTSFTLEIKSDLLEAESDRLMPVESGQIVETEEIVEEIISDDENLDFQNEVVAEKSIIKRIWKDPVKRKKAIYALAIIALIILLGDDGEDTNKNPPKKQTAQINGKNESKVKKIPKNLENERNVAYELGVSYFDQQRFDLAQIEFQKVINIDPEYKSIQSYMTQTGEALKRLQELEEQKRAEEDRLKIKKIVDEYLVKAKEAVAEHKVEVAENFFRLIIEKDPENITVSQLKLELEAWKREQEKIALEIAAKEAARKKMIDALNPGKMFYLKKEWYRAINKLEDFIRLQQIDEDLIKEATEMLSDAKNQLASELGPIIGKARSLKEGQDLKAAYEAFWDVLKIEPTNTEALNEVDEIKSTLENRSKKVYREAIIAESLSLFADAKEKLQEVQQISPTDSEYYKKATDKLRNYME